MADCVVNLLTLQEEPWQERRKTSMNSFSDLY